MVVEVGIEITYPQVIGVAHLLLLGIDARQAEGQAPGSEGGFGLYLIDIEGRIGHHIVALARQVVGIVVEGVGLVARDDAPVQAMHRHVHEAQLGIVLHFLLTVEGHLAVGVHAGSVDEVARLDKHAAAAASGVKHDALLGLQHVDEHLDQ